MSYATALYRFYDEAGDLLYVGITLNPGSRFKQHSHDKPWWANVRRIELETHPTRAAALAAETAAILSEGPRHNIVHNRPRSTAKVRSTAQPKHRDVAEPAEHAYAYLDAMTPAEARAHFYATFPRVDPATVPATKPAKCHVCRKPISPHKPTVIRTRGRLHVVHVPCRDQWNAENRPAADDDANHAQLRRIAVLRGDIA